VFNPYPDIQISHELLELMRAWHAQFPGTSMNWRTVVESPTKPWGLDRRLDALSAEVTAMYQRFSGPPLHEHPERPYVLWAATGSLHGVPVAGMFLNLPKYLGGMSGGEGDYRFTLTSSIDTPARKPRLVLCRRAGHVHHSPTGDPRFDDAFAVHADDRGFADAVLTPQFIDWYVSDPRSPHLPLIFENGTLSTGFGKPPKEKTEEYEEVHTLAHAPMADFLLQALGHLHPATWY
jgi:hypothetical protein